ncbi:hypothetical protein AMJ49_02755 [Parcubacteria bacterium DG_74_2]|nr:MAG: hypothetical protein AMJ49_02755 [Parcubacteria bacterium DG_74_2]
MLKLYNTLSRKKEVFRPQRVKKVNIFVCGPTVYDFSHLGHARTYIVFDVIARYLRQKEYKVFYLQNITDIDDRIIDRAKKEKILWKDLSRKFEREYFKDMRSLNINSVTKYARATDHIKEIISQVKRLLKKGFAYKIEDGIYYDISRFKDYGKLSKRTVLMAEDAISRIDEAKEKKNRGDFCLWKFSRKEDPKWKSSWNWGRPGWHIEDTAITENYFGPQYDIHGGGRDLIFPHHEAEIAQMEAISGKKPLVKYWLHTGFLTVKGVKMAKSLGNFITIRDFLKRHSARILRLSVIKNHYRSPVDYNEKEIERVKKQLAKIDEFLDKLDTIKRLKKKKVKKGNVRALISKTQKEFEKAMDDDFNTPKALASIFTLVTKGNKFVDKNEITPTDARDILKLLKKIDKVFNFIFLKKAKKERVPKDILKLVTEREKCRLKKNWEKADEIRQKIKKMGYWVKDTPKGPKIKKL